MFENGSVFQISRFNKIEKAIKELHYFVTSMFNLFNVA